MKKMILLFSLVLGMGSVGNSMAAIFKYTDEDGLMHYTDVPKSSQYDSYVPGKTVILGRPQEGEEEEVEPEEEPTAKVDYKIKITAPPHDKSYRSNSGNVTVSTSITPKLQKGDTVQLFDNGKPHGKPGSSTSFNLKALDRGTHNIEVRIMDKNKKVIASDSSIFHLQRRSAILQP